MVARKPVPLGKVYPGLQRLLDEKDARIAALEAELAELGKARECTPPTNCMYGPACSNHAAVCDDATAPPRCFMCFSSDEG